jgi:hypothetical protein
MAGAKIINLFNGYNWWIIGVMYAISGLEIHPKIQLIYLVWRIVHKLTITSTDML